MRRWIPGAFSPGDVARLDGALCSVIIFTLLTTLVTQTFCTCAGAATFARKRERIIAGRKSRRRRAGITSAAAGVGRLAGCAFNAVARRRGLAYQELPKSAHDQSRVRSIARAHGGHNCATRLPIPIRKSSGNSSSS